MPKDARIVTSAMPPRLPRHLHGLLRNRSELAHLVMFDSLTGLPNRRLLADRAAMAFARQARNPHGLCAVLFLDLDSFKQINDRHGHDAGDLILAVVGILTVSDGLPGIRASVSSPAAGSCGTLPASLQ